MRIGDRVIVDGSAERLPKKGLRREAIVRQIIERLGSAEQAYASGVVEGSRHVDLFST